jgi:hypothetical protein
LANLDQDFTAMELHYYHDRCPISFTTILPRCTPQAVLALLAPPPITLAPHEQPTPPPPHTILNRANRAHHPNALDYIDTTNVIFRHLRQAILQQWELRKVAMPIADSVTTLAWSIDQGLLFFDGRLYLPAALLLLPNLLQVLRQGGSTTMELIALDAHPPLMAV